MTIPKTVEQWRLYMNGYRDPETRKIEKEEFFEAYGDNPPGGFDLSGGGERECGYRKEGGTYATVPSSPYGKPVDSFLLCKPMPIVREEYNLANVGVKLVDVEQVCSSCNGLSPKTGFVCRLCGGTHKETVTHVFDIVGQEYYPNIADFMEEARRLGISRRLELEAESEYAKLSPRSRLFLLHHRAIIKNPGDFLQAMYITERKRFLRAGCPKQLLEHTYDNEDFDSLLLNFKAINNAHPGCSALYWNVLDEGAERIPEVLPELCNNCSKDIYATKPGQIYNLETDDLEVCRVCSGDKNTTQGRFSERKLKSGTYRGYTLPEGVKPDYGLGVFAVFPLGKIEVVDPDGSYQDRVSRASAARLDVEAVDC